jgi:hypothetical protein
MVMIVTTGNMGRELATAGGIASRMQNARTIVSSCKYPRRACWQMRFKFIAKIRDIMHTILDAWTLLAGSSLLVPRADGNLGDSARWQQ